MTDIIKARIENRSIPEPNSGCWLWLGSLVDGYGQMLVDRRVRGAHRVSYEAHVGQVPEGLVLDHKCRTRCCVNPLHLEPVTHLENVRRGWRVTKTHCTRGHELTPDNLYSHPRGYRQCATCKRAWMQRHRERKAAE